MKPGESMHERNSQNIRQADLTDVEKITVLINAAFRLAEGFFVDQDRIDTAEVRSLFDTGAFLVTESAETLTGCVYIEARGERTYLGLLSVDPSSQQGGLGSLLVNAAEDEARKLGSQFMDINIVNLREELPFFYRKRGYFETGTSPFPEEVQTKLPCHFINMSKSL
jgi:N-acetylglutamate synthase-like GNAT family acetyltransferase